MTTSMNALQQTIVPDPLRPLAANSPTTARVRSIDTRRAGLVCSGPCWKIKQTQGECDAVTNLFSRRSARRELARHSRNPAGDFDFGLGMGPDHWLEPPRPDAMDLYRAPADGILDLDFVATPPTGPRAAGDHQDQRHQSHAGSGVGDRRARPQLDQ